MTLRNEIKLAIQIALGECLEEPQKTIMKVIMKTIAKRVAKIDVGEMIKACMWENGKNTTYGNISEYVEKHIAKELK